MTFQPQGSCKNKSFMLLFTVYNYDKHAKIITLNGLLQFVREGSLGQSD